MIHRCWKLVLSTGLLMFLAACSRAPRIDTQQVAAGLIQGDLPREDPSAAIWDSASEHPARLMVQDVTEPRLVEPGVELVRVRAVHNGDWISFRLEWEDPSKDTIPVSGRSCDAAAIQFPSVSGVDVPDAAMGQKGKGVVIWYWKSVWQDDAERAKDGKGDRVASLYPNATIDHYPFTAGGEARTEMEKRYAPAMAAGNPILARTSSGPVQVLAAEGFGSSTAAATQPGAGRGLWEKGRWAVTISRPLQMGDQSAKLEPGKRTYVAFAVWDGSKRHTGSRKMRSGWISLLLEAR